MPRKAHHTLTESSIILSLPDWSVKVNDGWHYRNINIYLQYSRLQWTKYLHCHCLIVPHASIDFAKRATSDRFSPWGYSYESSRTDGFSQTEDSGKFASEVCIFIIRAGKFLEHRLKLNILLQTASNCFYLQTLSESTGFSVTGRWILPCLDKILDIVGNSRKISAIVKCELISRNMSGGE